MNSLPAQSKTKRTIGKMLRSLAAVLLIATVAGFVYEEVGRRQDRQRLPQIGQSVDIGGRTLNIYCSGDGSPAVILDSGAGHPGYAWAHIQPEIAKFTRACWYDRAGEGWSDPGPFPRTSAASAQDLHELLQRAGVPAPYVLVGHSLGGLNVRVYNGLYPSEVAGMVLVDSAHEDEPKRAPKFMLGPTLPQSLWYPLYLTVRAGERFGLVRLLSPSAPLHAEPAQRTRAQIVEALRQQPKSVANRSGDATAPESYEQARTAAGLGDRPLIVLTRGRPFSPSGDSEMDRLAATYEQVWRHELQVQLARLSTRGRQVIVENSGHGIPDEAPAAVIDAVREVVMVIRGGSSMSSAASR
jgi:pimeloyl-ACP methyl ester carboxylesterase